MINEFKIFHINNLPDNETYHMRELHKHYYYFYYTHHHLQQIRTVWEAGPLGVAVGTVRPPIGSVLQDLSLDSES